MADTALWYENVESMGGVAVFASHHRDPGSIPGLGVICE
jgi:hypothetical protein